MGIFDQNDFKEMRTIEVAILSDQDETLIMDVLKAFEQQNRVSLREKDATYLPGQPFLETEFDQLIEKAERSQPYTYEQARAFLGL